MPNDKKGETTLDDLAQMITRSFDGMMRYMQENFATKKDIEGVNARIDTVEKNLSARIDKVEENIGAVKDELVSLGHKTERLERKMETIANTLDERMGEQEKEIRRVKSKVGMIA